jgi:hypothetical protein
MLKIFSWATAVRYSGVISYLGRIAMDQKKQLDDEKFALENAAKYICNLKCGLCPLIAEGFNCEFDCNLETVPWKCWRFYFRQIALKGSETGKSGKAA